MVGKCAVTAQRTKVCLQNVDVVVRKRCAFGELAFLSPSFCLCYSFLLGKYK